ncbi:MAG: PEP-CTERM sorting domain-containing protein [Akkermansia sp.]|nr:PEP-CTERM sorting domain-containing protein [Akkermansia sp.]
MKRTLFILALSALSLSSAHAAVGDSIAPNDKVVYHVDGVKMSTTYGTASWDYASVVQAESTRLYDSNKGGPWTGSYSNGKEYDSLMCWTHVATNSIQYWQDVYGVFYKDTGNMSATGSGSARNLPNGYISTESITESGNDAVVNNARELYIAETFYKSWKNTGGSFGDAADWFFKADSKTNPWDANGTWSYADPHPGKDYDDSFSCGTPGGYYSEYFGDGNSKRDAFVTINAADQTSATYSTFAYNDREALKQALLAGLGFTQQADGTYVQTQEGMLAALSLSGHVLNCYGFTTDANGTLNTVLIADGDNGTTRLQELLIKEVNGKLVLYRRSSSAYTNSSTYIDGVSYINTPEVLQNMLKEYRSLDEAAVWNGKGTGGIWETQVDVVDSVIADETTGWDVLVNGDNIDAKHHDYYHGYALEGRNVLFDDHAAEEDRTVTINGTVSAGRIEVAAEGYAFKMGTDGGAIAPGADMTVRSDASLYSEVELVLGDLELEQGALLRSTETITVEGAFLTSLQESASFSLRNAVTPSVSVEADLDLREATSITLNTAVDMNGHDLLLSAQTPITISLSEVDGSILFFTNVGTLSVLTIEGITEVITPGTDLTQYFNITSADGTDLSGYCLVYADGALAMSIVPEPTTATLSLLALAALAARRRRK